MNLENSELTKDDYAKAFTEVSFLLDVFSSTLTSVMGGGLVSVGRVAGRRAARKLPVHLPDPDLTSVLEAVAAQFRRAFDAGWQLTPSGAELSFGRCVIREVCERRNTAPGGDLCRLFHCYLDGVVNEFLARPVKSSIAGCGPECIVELGVR